MKKNIIVIFMMSISTICSAQFSGQGSGTEKDPYLVSNADELFEVRNDLSAYYKQVEDIDLGPWIKDDNPVQGWNPIGTENTPFTGVYDGNRKKIFNLYINKPNNDNIGLFGYAISANLKNIELVNSKVIGRYNVAILLGIPYGGFVDRPITKVYNCSCIIGEVKGDYNIGSITGGFYDGEFSGNVSFCSLEGKGDIGGIVGRFQGSCDVKDNLFCGEINCKTKNGGETRIGGIIGSADVNGSHYEILRNVFVGNIHCTSNANGIIGYNYNTQFHNNVCIADTIAASSAYAIGTTGNNYSSSNIVYIKDGKVTAFDDNSLNGTQYGLKTLKKRTTYEGMGFDFSSQWQIDEGQSYPYMIYQSNRPIVNAFVCGSKSSISGSADYDGDLYVLVSDNLYKTTIVDGMWELSLGNLSEGTKATIIGNAFNKGCSIPVFAYAKKEIHESESLLGDSNADGVVDAADVVGTINYILGKPSSSYNHKNADINEDGQILVDDAVGTVNVIMNNQ